MCNYTKGFRFPCFLISYKMVFDIYAAKDHLQRENYKPETIYAFAS